MSEIRRAIRRSRLGPIAGGAIAVATIVVTIAFLSTRGPSLSRNAGATETPSGLSGLESAAIDSTIGQFSEDPTSQVIVVRTNGAKAQTIRTEAISPDDAALASDEVLIVSIRGGQIYLAQSVPSGAAQATWKLVGAQYAIDVATGQVLWQYETRDAASLKDASGLGPAFTYAIQPPK
jgi:outer membrane protein assembly factor BamB